MERIIVFVLIAFMMPLSVYGACPDDDYEVTACVLAETGTCRLTCDLSYTKVRNTIRASSSGDGVYFPEGEGTWDTTMDERDSKKLTYKGAGTLGERLTTITLASQSIKWWFWGETRLSNIKLVIATPSTERSTMVTFRAPKVILDHNFFAGYDYTVIELDTNNISESNFVRGVAYNNVFENIRLLVGYSGVVANATHKRWATATRHGDADAFFIEDNLYIRNDNRTGSNIVDSNGGHRYVVRYNTISVSSTISSYNALAHGLQMGADHRSTKTVEVYGNLWRPEGHFANATFTRGGSGRIWMNKVMYNTGTPNAGMFQFDYRRDMSADFNDSLDCGPTGAKRPCYLSDNNTTFASACDGDSNIDSNYEADGWLCRDMIGAGTDSKEISFTCGVGASPDCGTQAKDPMYYWHNYVWNTQMYAHVSYGTTKAQHMAVNRDYYYSKDASCNGAACTTGVGCGTLGNRPANCTKGVAYWATDQDVCGGSLAGYIGASADRTSPETYLQGALYICTDTNTWSAVEDASTYVPYTYPHPLRGVGEPDPEDPDEIKPTVSLAVEGPAAFSVKMMVVGWDNIGVTGYCINEVSEAPTSGTCAGTGWLARAPTSYRFTSAGAKTLYGWAKDAAGNISSAASTAVTIRQEQALPYGTGAATVTVGTGRQTMGIK